MFFYIFLLAGIRLRSTLFIRNSSLVLPHSFFSPLKYSTNFFCIITISKNAQVSNQTFFAQVQFTWGFKSVDCSRYVGVSLSFVMILSEAGYTILSDSVFWLHVCMEHTGKKVTAAHRVKGDTL